jgi:hypothetical protein
MWSWYTLIGLATALACVVYFGKTSDAVAQLMPPSMTRFQFNCSAVFSALMVAVAWPAFWYMVYDANRPKS